MEEKEIKNEIIAKINEIDDVEILNSLKALLESSDDTIAKFLSFATEQMKNGNMSETKNYTDYIKEWVKNM